LQSLDFLFKLCLFVLIGLAHHRELFICDAPRHIILVNADKQTVKLSQPLFSLCQPLLVSTDRGFAGQPESLLYDGTEMILIPTDIGNDSSHVHPDQFFQNNRADKVCRTASRIAAVVGAYKMILPLFKVVRGTVAHFCSTISAIDHAGKQAALARLCPAVTLLANLLHLVKDLLLDDRRVGVVENHLFFNRRFPLLLVPDGIGVGLEIDCASRVFPPFQNVNNRVGVPMVRISGFRAGCLDALALFVGGRIKYLFLLQELCDLHRASPFHAQLENALDYQCRRFIHDPLHLVLRVFAVAERNIGGQGNAAFALRLIDSTNFAAGVLGKKLVSQPRIKNDGLCFDISDKIVVDVNIAFLVIVHGIAFADLNFLNQAHQRGTA